MIKPIVVLMTDMDKALESMTFAAKLCFGKENDTLTKDAQTTLMEKILASKHFSILEHATAGFYIMDVSRNFTHQFVRHRHMSFAQQSFHYTVAKDKVVPVAPQITSVQEEVMETAFAHAFASYEELLKMGVPKEEARHVLPSGILTRIYATASIREWMQFVTVRACAVNCYEIKAVALEIRKELCKHLSFMEPYLGPTCYTEGACHEGKKYCGHPWRGLK